MADTPANAIALAGGAFMVPTTDANGLRTWKIHYPDGRSSQQQFYQRENGTFTTNAAEAAKPKNKTNQVVAPYLNPFTGLPIDMATYGQGPEQTFFAPWQLTLGGKDPTVTTPTPTPAPTPTPTPTPTTGGGGDTPSDGTGDSFNYGTMPGGGGGSDYGGDAGNGNGGLGLGAAALADGVLKRVTPPGVGDALFNPVGSLLRSGARAAATATKSAALNRLEPGWDTYSDEKKQTGWDTIYRRENTTDPWESSQYRENSAPPTWKDVETVMRGMSAQPDHVINPFDNSRIEVEELPEPQDDGGWTRAWNDETGEEWWTR